MAAPQNPFKKHGHARDNNHSPEYDSWQHARQRCNNPKAKGYAEYGGSGITMCDRWRDFSAFLADMGPRPEGTSLDRIDSKKGYEPGNCRWATPLQQAWNTRKVKMIEFNGKRMSVRGWARELGITHTTLQGRLAAWPLEKALTHAAVPAAERWKHWKSNDPEHSKQKLS